jgi:hypothetical protein
MDLGSGGNEIKCPQQPVQSSRNNPNAAGTLHPRYTITIHGCSHTEYTPIEGDGNLYRKLLGRDMFAELGQQHQANLAAVHRLVPVWSRDDESLGWVKSGRQRGNGNLKWR